MRAVWIAECVDCHKERVLDEQPAVQNDERRAVTFAVTQEGGKEHQCRQFNLWLLPVTETHA